MKRSLLLANVLVLGIVSSALADLDWGFIATGGDPDFVTVFDLDNPGASNTNVGTCATNFNRGMDYYGLDDFYYFVSTDSLNQPGERGLWRWNNNVNTQLFNTAFNDSGDGDATLSNDFTKYYVAVDDGVAPAGDSLYVFENLNGAVTFTEVGEIGLTQLFGIAMDPLSGMLYGIDGATDSLYTINTTTAAPTLVGPTGVALGAIGGMDFSADGQTLLLANARNLLKIDKTSGAATPVGDAILNISALSFRVPEPSSLAMLVLAAGVLTRRRELR